LSVKLPDGRRLQAKFSKEVTVEQLYAWIDCEAFEPGYQAAPSATSPPRGYQHQYEFTLVTMFPKRTLAFQESKTLDLQSAGLVPSASLLVEGMALATGESSDEEVSEDEA